jgi:CubicO group peptidase (beta-lactamase class C family)
MEEGQIPSLQAGIVVGDELVWAKGYGAQPNLDTVFMLGSISKTFTSTAFLQLAEDGTINLDADINLYLDFSVRHPGFPSVAITIRQLLSHTAGLVRDYPYGLYWYGNSIVGWLNDHVGSSLTLWPEPHPPLEEMFVAAWMSSSAIWAYEPGTVFSYSNFGYAFLAYLFEQIVGQSLPDYVEANIFAPLGMIDAGYWGADFPGHHAFPHERLANGTICTLPIFDAWDFGAGPLRSSVPSLARFLIAHMNDGTSDAFQLLEPATTALMHTPVLGGYGLGWFCDGIGTQGHGGVDIGYMAEMRFRVNDHGPYGIILLMNRASTIALRDNELLSSQSAIVNLLFEEAALLSTLGPNGTDSTPPPPLLIVGVVVGIIALVVVTFSVVVWEKRR